ncbi:aggregation-promoting factor C-terminal-like domain-containing protein [Staphylococcus pasteuri]|uniref:aggregation-promoting factor C-terminal-like domain-containing protein n=1 Tax=Staphylococcus pasteuri TaxID=45972 RepID=UPI002DBBD5DF|nr:transglycosylase [Staphylococcus pasteuri]MEB6612979.1 transglycosylase [Staphylococcus pasteuri]
MKKSILAIIATVSIGATGLEAHQAHAAENNQPSQCSPQQNQSFGNQQQDKSSSVSSNYQTTQTSTQSTSSESKSSTSEDSSSSSESSSDVYKEFIEAGGTKELWDNVVMPESGGDPDASNGQYHGLGQTNQSWGYGSVATQTKGMINYAKERYGSIDAAISFRESNGYW